MPAGNSIAFLKNELTMKNTFPEKFDKLKAAFMLQKKIEENSASKAKLYSSVLPESFKILLASSIAKQNKNVVILFPRVQEVNEAKVELGILGNSEKIIAVDALNQDVIQETLTNLNKAENYILLAPYKLLKLQLPQKEQLEKNTTIIEPGDSIPYDELLEYLNLLNYNKDKFVDAPGMFSVRGSIIDFWSFSEKRPSRLEYDGDFLESIRYFDPESQRSAGRIEVVTLASSIEFNEDEKYTDIFEYLDNPLVFASQFELDNLFEPEKEVKEEIKTDDLDDDLREEIFERDVEEVEDEEVKTDLEKIEISGIDTLFKKNVHWFIEDELGRNENRIIHKLLRAPVINSNFELLFNQLKEYVEEGNKVIITTENEMHAKRMYDLLTDYHTHLSELFDSKKITIVPLAIKKGFVAKEDNLAVLTDYQIFNKPYRTKVSTKKKYKKQSGKELASIKRGDYVVHETYGIGQYAGLENIKIGKVEQESIKILYAEGGVVYVNLNYFALVKKFNSGDESKPKLSVLGSNEWKNQKKKVKKKIKDAARGLITLYAKRKASEGFPFSMDTIWQKELEASFFYEDTPDQSKVTDEVKIDMESENPMDRLVCGDVGFGKTEIAVRAAFKAVNDGKQVAVLVPTTILAEQHYNTFKDRLTQFPVQTHSLSRFRSKAAQKETLDKLYEGGVDIVIGTHRLLSKDIKFKDLGLLIIDEEQRFGVMAKEKLREIKSNVDTLTLTATPIPRTLNLSLLGARDLSIIATPPPNRQPVYTKVEVFDIHKIREWVMEEVKRNGQIFFVHDRVQSIDKIAGYVQRHIPEIKIGIAHGQMKASQLEKVIYDFMNKEYHMLIATKIIESGLDIPNANTIIVNRADRFGLAELHQLRGRVGRSDKKAFAYFLAPSMKTITKKAVRRLQAIEEHAGLGEGFNLSMRDLEIRGAGNLLGTEQSGSINTVGFEMYVKLLDEAVEELKYSEFRDVFKDLPEHEERTEPTIDTYFEIGIPKDYMIEQVDRLSYYTALFSMKEVEEAEEIKDEISDKFGKLPEKVEQLIATAVLRYYASRALFDRVVIMEKKISLILPKGEKEDYYQNKFQKLMTFILENYSKNIKFEQGKDVMKLVMTNNFDKPLPAIEYLIKFCKTVMNRVINPEKQEMVEIK